MPRLKITGYIDTDSLRADEVDLDHETGLSSHGYETLVQDIHGTDASLNLRLLEDVEVEVER